MRSKQVDDFKRICNKCEHEPKFAYLYEKCKCDGFYIDVPTEARIRRMCDEFLSREPRERLACNDFIPNQSSAVRAREQAVRVVVSRKFIDEDENQLCDSDYWGTS